MVSVLWLYLTYLLAIAEHFDVGFKNEFLNLHTELGLDKRQINY